MFIVLLLLCRNEKQHYSLFFDYSIVGCSSCNRSSATSRYSTGLQRVFDTITFPAHLLLVLAKEKKNLQVVLDLMPLAEGVGHHPDARAALAFPILLAHRLSLSDLQHREEYMPSSLLRHQAPDFEQNVCAKMKYLW